MATFQGAPRIVKGGIVVVDPAGAGVRRVIPLQYNPASITRSLQIQDTGGGGGGDRSEALRIKASPVETLELEARIDATDRLEDGDPQASELGIAPELAALEALAYPTSAALLENDRLAGQGTLEILPMQAPLTIFVWSRERIVPVRITSLSITEEAFSPGLLPLSATVKLGLRVLSVDDLGFAHRGGSLFMSYLQAKEGLADRAAAGTLSQLGIGEIP